MHFSREAIHNCHRILAGVRCSVNRQILKVVSLKLTYLDLGRFLWHWCVGQFDMSRELIIYIWAHFFSSTSNDDLSAALITWYIVPPQSGYLILFMISCKSRISSMITYRPIYDPFKKYPQACLKLGLVNTSFSTLMSILTAFILVIQTL